jgi:uncharacterized protein YecT (DUF1311 family)
MRTLLCFGVIVFAVTGSWAQTQAEMNAEAAEEFAAADARLNAVYKNLVAGLDDESRALLRKSQRAWVVFRDAEAAYVADRIARGGSIAPLEYFGRRTRLTEERIKQLEEAFAEP